jgi:hypothetical protein
MLSSTILDLMAVGALAMASPAGAQLCRSEGIQQLRIYEIFDGNKAAFHDRFRDHALRIMKRHGFEVISIWETSHGERTEFAYLLHWPDEATMKRQWAAFMADEEWSQIKREWAAVHGQAVGEIQDLTLKRVPYSPC